jgi:hypothetical protein
MKSTVPVILPGPVNEADHQRDGAHDLEVQQRKTAGLAHLLHVFHAGDADHHRAEDDRRDDHLDELDEAVAQRLHGLAERGIEVAEQHADDHRGDHLHVKGSVQRELLGGCTCCVFHGASRGFGTVGAVWRTFYSWKPHRLK